MTEITIRKITSPEDLEKCFHIRTVVFIDEQNVPEEEEMDGLDSVADQYLLTVDGEATATCRVRYSEAQAKIERVAVLENQRGLNVGKRLMEHILTDISQKEAIAKAVLGAQVQVIGFYEKLGFEAYGEEFLDAGIRHKWMKKAV